MGLDTRNRDHLLMTAVGGLQGLALHLVHRSWPSDPHPAASFFSLVSFIVASGLVIHFARDGKDQARLATLAVATGAVFALITLWVGWQIPPKGAPFGGDDSRLATWACAAGIALYALGPFIQIFQASGRFSFPYTELYRHSWNNFFVAALAAVFAGALWTVLVLWGELFGLIGVDSFKHLFAKEWFIYVTTGAAIGYGLAVGLASREIIVTLRGLTQALFRLLLPLLALVSVGFLVALPFTGLAPLLRSRSASTILIGWVASYALFLNAVYLDGSAPPPYGAWLRRLCELGTLCLPGLSGVALHAARLRVVQYGLTPERVFGLVFIVVLGAYAIGYAGAVLLQGEPWLPRLRQVNVGLAGVVIVVACLLHTPVLDPMAWSLRNQLARLRQGVFEPATFDFAYLRFHLGRRGYEALQQLVATAPADADAASLRRMRSALEVQSYREWSRDHGMAVREDERFRRPPFAGEWPPGLQESLGHWAVEEWELRECDAANPCWVFPTDLDGDGQPEELVAASPYGYGHPVVLVAFKRAEKGDWTHIGSLRRLDAGAGASGIVDWNDAIAAGKAHAIDPLYRDVEILGQRFRLDRGD